MKESTMSTLRTTTANNLIAAERAAAAAWENYTAAAALLERAIEHADYYRNKAERTADKAAAREAEKAATEVAYLQAARAAARKELTKAQTHLVRCRDKAQGKRVPVTTETLYGRAAVVAYAALRAANDGSRIQRADDGTVKGGGNTGYLKPIERTKSQSYRALTNAKTETAYLDRSATDFDDIRQEVALAMWETLQAGAAQEEIYAAGFSAANRWIYANKTRPAAKHAYSFSWSDDGSAPEIVDVTKGFAALLNGVCDSALLAEIKASCTDRQWAAIVLTAKGNSAAMIAKKWNVPQTSVESLIRKVRNKARAAYGSMPAAEVDSYSIISAF